MGKKNNLWKRIKRNLVLINGDTFYIFKVKEDIKFNTDIKGLTFNSDFLQVQKNGVMIVKGANPKYSGYAWNGCSPKFGFFDIVFGTPDGIIDPKTNKPKAYFASMIHDVLYQYSKDFKKNISRRQADKLFLNKLKDFKPRYLYYFMVRMCGWLAWRRK